MKVSIEHGIKLKYSKYAIDNASQNGHINVLDWWLKTSIKYKIKLKYSNYSIYYASNKNNHKVLVWWLNASIEHGLVLKYGEINTYIDILNKDTTIWWIKILNEHNKKSNKDIKYTNFASTNECINTLDWWLKINDK